MFKCINTACHPTRPDDRTALSEQLPECADIGERDRLDERSSKAAESTLRFDHDGLSVRVKDQAVSYRVNEGQKVHTSLFDHLGHDAVMRRIEIRRQFHSHGSGDDLAHTA